MKNVPEPLAKNVPLGLTSTASAADAPIHKKLLVRKDGIGNLK